MIDANSQFFAILTNVGMAKQANADALGIPWKLTEMGVGDANGADSIPSATQTQLIHEWRRRPLNQLKIDPANPAVIIAEQVIPADEGGFWIREIGLYDADGDLVAVANCAPSFKPVLSQGSGRTQVVRMNFIVSSSANITLKIDPSVVLATREYVDTRVQDELYKLDSKQSVRVAATANIALSGLQTVDGVALLAGDRVLVPAQTAAKDNGVYVVASGPWVRAADSNTSAKVTSGLTVTVEEGSANGDSLWQLVTNGPVNLGTTALLFEMLAGRTGIQAGTYKTLTVDKYGRATSGANPETLAGFGIKDTYTKAEVELMLAQAQQVVTNGSVIGLCRGVRAGVPVASVSATFTANEVIAGHPVSGIAYRALSFNKSVNLTQTGVGGMDVGIAPLSGYVAIYAIYNPTANLWGLLAKNASAAAETEMYTGANMPAGYTVSVLLSVLATDASRQLKPFDQEGRTVFVYGVSVLNTIAISGGFTAFSVASAVPRNAKRCQGHASVFNVSAGYNSYGSVAGRGGVGGQSFCANPSTAGNAGLQAAFADMPITSEQTLYYSLTGSNGTPSLGVVISGYSF